MAKARKLNLTGSDPEYAKRDFEQPRTGTNPLKKKPSNNEASSKESVKPSDGLDYRVNLNMALKITAALGAKLSVVAKEHNVPESPIIKASRLKAHTRLRKMIANGVKPSESANTTPAGNSIKYTGVFTGEEAKILTEWFDPLSIGVPNEAVRPTLEKFLTEEIEAIVSRSTK